MTETSTPIFDVEGARDRVAGDLELLQELVALFFSGWEAQQRELSLALEATNFPKAREIAHSAKSALGNLGAVRAYELAHKLEISCRDGATDSVQQMSKVLSQAVTEFEVEVKRFFAAST